jgi:hypothetical protein
VPSVWITTRATARGGKRYRVMYRLGGRESAPRYGGSFRTKREALARKAWLTGELAALGVPNLRPEDAAAATLRSVAASWLASRVDVAPGTLATYRIALARILPRLDDQAINRLDAQMVAALVADLHEAGLRKQTIRKTVSVLAMVLDDARVQPNPARDRLTVRLPREERRQVEPPRAEQVEAVVRLLPSRYRLPLLVLDATGMRVGELEALSWGDLDEPRVRWRIATSKTGRPRWVSPPPLLSRRSSNCARATTAIPTGECSRPSRANGSAPRSRAPVPRQACRPSRRTISATAASRYSTSAACRGPASASSSATTTS